MKRFAVVVLPLVAALGFIFATSVPSAAAPEDSLDQALTELIAANRVSGERNSYRRDNPGEYQRVVAYINGGTRPTGTLSRLGLGLVLVEDTRRELAGETTTTTTETTTTTTPPVTNCTVDNWQAWGPTYEPGECGAGTTIELLNTEWHCRQPLSFYGPLPIRVVSRWNAQGNASIAASVNSGCTGVPGSDINLIVEVINTDGQALITDVFKTRTNGNSNIRMTGRLEGGRRNPADHQDCIQLQGGGNAGANYLVNVSCPDYASGQAQVQGAGGALFWSINQNRVVVLGGEYIGCNHSLNVHNRNQDGSAVVQPGSRIEGAKFRSGNTTTAFCQGFFANNACVGPGLASLPRVNVICQRYVNGAWVDQ